MLTLRLGAFLRECANLSHQEIRGRGFRDNIDEEMSEWPVAKAGLRRIRDDMRFASGWTGLEQPRRGEAIEDRHGDIHQNDDRLRVVREDDAFETIRSGRHLNPQGFECGRREFPAVLRVVDNEDVSSIRYCPFATERFADEADRKRLCDLPLLSRVDAQLSKRRQQTGTVMKLGDYCLLVRPRGPYRLFR